MLEVYFDECLQSDGGAKVPLGTMVVTADTGEKACEKISGAVAKLNNAFLSRADIFYTDKKAAITYPFDNCFYDLMQELSITENDVCHMNSKGKVEYIDIPPFDIMEFVSEIVSDESIEEMFEFMSEASQNILSYC